MKFNTSCNIDNQKKIKSVSKIMTVFTSESQIVVTWTEYWKLKYKIGIHNTTWYINAYTSLVDYSPMSTNLVYVLVCLINYWDSTVNAKWHIELSHNDLMMVIYPGLVLCRDDSAQRPLCGVLRSKLHRISIRRAF